MTFENMNTDDFFPLLQQTLSDTFKIDSYLMHAPYQNFEKMDMGLRRMVWGNYKTNSPLFSLFGSSPYQIIVLQSSLGFYNVIVSLTTDAEPDILGIMPFLAEPINQVTINRLIRDNHIDPKYNSVLLHFYYSLPVVDIDELTLMLQHFISFSFRRSKHAALSMSIIKQSLITLRQTKNVFRNSLPITSRN